MAVARLTPLPSALTSKFAYMPLVSTSLLETLSQAISWLRHSTPKISFFKVNLLCTFQGARWI